MPAGFQPDAGCRVVDTVGRLAAVKDQQALIRALAHIFGESPQRRQTLRCIIVGDGPERAALTAADARHGLEDSVWLAGERGDIPDLLACMDVPALAAAVTELVDDTARCDQMGRAAVQRITTDFEWERIVSAYLWVYDELLGLASPSGQMDRT